MAEMMILINGGEALTEAQYGVFFNDALGCAELREFAEKPYPNSHGDAGANDSESDLSELKFVCRLSDLNYPESQDSPPFAVSLPVVGRLALDLSWQASDKHTRTVVGFKADVGDYHEENEVGSLAMRAEVLEFGHAPEPPFHPMERPLTRLGSILSFFRPSLYGQPHPASIGRIYRSADEETTAMSLECSQCIALRTQLLMGDGFFVKHDETGGEDDPAASDAPIESDENPRRFFVPGGLNTSGAGRILAPV